jgi:F5/8 type C domain-containing protein/parallel beta helix pectate lyase-like protein
MRPFRSSLVALSVTATAVLVAASPAAAAATNYYVDCSATAAGSGTQASPWNSFTPVNAKTFAGGDQILIKRGTTCTGQQLYPKGSGASGAPIVVDAYGSGAKPVLAGNGAVVDVVKLYNQQYWDIRNLDISNQGATAATRRGVHILRENSGTGTYYRLSGLSIHNVNGDQTRKDDDASAGIFFEVLGYTTATKFDDVLISNNTITTVDRYGIHFWTRWMTRPELANPNCGSTCGTWTPQTRIVVRGNTVTDIGGDAVDVHHSQGSLVENNRVDGFRVREPAHCAAGIWGWNINDALFQFNEVSGGRSECDGQGLDLDEGNIRTIYQYNYSHDNEGGFILLCNGGGSTTKDNVVRYNISQNDRGQIFDLVCGKLTNTKIYNNVFYVGQPGQIINNGNGSAGSNVEFYNNIFYVTSPAASYNAGSLLFDSNVFYGQHPAGEPADPNKITADPLFVSPGTATSIGNATGYKLRAGSPALANGQAMSAPGSRDYFGGAVTAGCRPDRGAHQLSTVCTPNAVVVPRTNWTLRYADSQETAGENGAATNAFDNNTATYWHTKWSGGSTPLPHEIQINLGASYAVSGIRYLPRQDGGTGAGNGRIGQYEVYVSTDGVTWGTAVATGTFADNASQKEVRFTAKTGRYLRLRALSEVNGNPWTTAAEIYALS